MYCPALDLDPLVRSAILTHCVDRTQRALQCFISFCSPQPRIPPLLDCDPTLYHPVPWVFPNQKTLCSPKKWKHPDERKRCFVRQAAFLSLLLTHKHSQVQLSPRPVRQDTEPDKQSHRYRAGINIGLITLLTSDSNICTKESLKTASLKPPLQKQVWQKANSVANITKMNQRMLIILPKQEHFMRYKDVLSRVLILIWIPKKSAVSSLALKQEVELWLSSARLV